MPAPRDCDENLFHARERLREKIDRLTRGDCIRPHPVPGLTLRRHTAITGPAGYMHEPGMCLVVQGAKRVFLGEEEYVYNEQHYLLTSVDVPVRGQVIEASPGRPFLGLLFHFDLHVLAEVMAAGNLPRPRPAQTGRGMAMGRLTAPLLQAFERLVDLLEHPDDIPVLAPLLQREIICRLLLSEQGEGLRQLATAGCHCHSIALVLRLIRQYFDRPLRIEDLAFRAGMSVSSLHLHFKNMTAMSPLQYQKWIRLHEARRLMLTGNYDATRAAAQVGYESASQFNREYSRLFGAPPLRDMRRMHRAAIANPT